MINELYDTNLFAILFRFNVICGANYLILKEGSSRTENGAPLPPKKTNTTEQNIYRLNDLFNNFSIHALISCSATLLTILFITSFN